MPMIQGLIGIAGMHLHCPADTANNATGVDPIHAGLQRGSSDSQGVTR